MGSLSFGWYIRAGLLERQTWQSLPGNGGIASKASVALASPCLSPIDLESRNETYVLSSRVQIVGSEEELNRIEMATIASLTRPHNHSTRRRMGEPRIRCNQTKPQNRPGLRKPGKVMRKPKKGSNPFSPTRSQFGLLQRLPLACMKPSRNRRSAIRR